MARNWAICVGVNEYDNLPNLSFAKRDAEQMQQYFQSDVKFDKVYLFTDDSPPIDDANKPYASRPTYGALRRFLRVRFEEEFLSDGDNLWFFFSGHGIRHQDRDYLLPSDADPDPAGIEDTAIPISYVSERLRRSGADNVILLLDACRSEQSSKDMGIGYEKQQGVITFSSCSPAERSYEIEELEQGAFTYALLESLKIQGEGSCATVDRLERQLKYRVKEINRDYQKPTQLPYTIVEPTSKYHLILLPDQASQADIDLLKTDAFRAQINKNWLLAKQLWRRVNVAAKGRDYDAEEGLAEAIFWLKKSATPEKFFTDYIGDGIPLKMCLIPKGSFLMGATKGDLSAHSTEKPRHQVVINNDFYMSPYLITQNQWQVIMGNNPSHFIGLNNPVENVSWNDVQDFLEKLNQKTMKSYRLPSEAEWEYACRAGTDSIFYFGNDEHNLHEYAWYLANSGDQLLDVDKSLKSSLKNFEKLFQDNNSRTHPVGQKKPNNFGLHDMLGNVREWCLDDYWGNNYQGAPMNGQAWYLAKSQTEWKIGHGGSFDDDFRCCRPSFRCHGKKTGRYYTVGFRVVLPIN